MVNVLEKSYLGQETRMVSLLIALLAACLSLGTCYPQQTANTRFKIVGGQTTDISQIPYQAAFIDNDELLCGGAIISKTFILTSGSCCVDADLPYFRVGSNYYSKGGESLKIKRIIPHPKLRLTPKFYDYDICLIEVENPIKFDKNTQPIPIADTRPNVGDTPRVAGWGQTGEDADISDTLQSVLVPVTNNSYCLNAYPNIPSMDRVICAGKPGKDSCDGDSGSPLTWSGKIVGVSSFGSGCAEPGFPGVYASVINPELRQFIKTIANV